MIDIFSLTSGIPKYYNQLLSRTDKLLAHSLNFHNNIQELKHTSKENSKVVPSNATIRSEDVKCGKPHCLRCPHGPYYYAYWREKGKLKKKYIGTKYEPEWKSNRKNLLKDKQTRYITSESLAI